MERITQRRAKGYQKIVKKNIYIAENGYRGDRGRFDKSV